jgi:lipoprotein-anchoring transpeptidase ErfK/SrfK
VRRTTRLSLSLALAATAVACRGSQPVVDRSPATTTPASPIASPSLQSEPPTGREPAGVDAISNDRYLPMWKRPGGGDADFVFDAKSPVGNGVAPMLVDGRRTIDGRDWVRILLPIRPNGSSAWAPVDEVRIVPRNERIVVDLSQRILRHFVRGKLVNRFRVAVGSPATPTGTGTFYVWMRVPFSNPNQAYGIFALGLSGFSPVLSDWPGGGRMAIHGTPNASDRGRPVSHGCVRVYNDDMKHLTGVRLGTPVVIRP